MASLINQSRRHSRRQSNDLVGKVNAFVAATYNLNPFAIEKVEQALKDAKGNNVQERIEDAAFTLVLIRGIELSNGNSNTTTTSPISENISSTDTLQPQHDIKSNTNSTCTVNEWGVDSFTSSNKGNGKTSLSSLVDGVGIGVGGASCEDSIRLLTPRSPNVKARSSKLSVKDVSSPARARGTTTADDNDTRAMKKRSVEMYEDLSDSGDDDVSTFSCGSGYGKKPKAQSNTSAKKK